MNNASTPSRDSISSKPFSCPNTKQAVDKPSAKAESADTMVTDNNPLRAG